MAKLINPMLRQTPRSRAVIYCRITRASRINTKHLIEQISSMTKLVGRWDNFYLSDTYIDFESSAEELLKLATAVKSCRIKLILFESMSCLLRDDVDIPVILQAIKQSGCEIRFFQENVTSKDQEIDYAFLRQTVSRIRSDQIRAGQNTLAKSGQSGLYNIKCYGYDQDENGSLIINESQAKVVRQIYDLYCSGYSVVKIINELHQQGIPSPSGKDQWNKRTIEKILSNEKYIGNSIILRNSYRSSENHPAIISTGTYKTVQDEKAARSNVEIDENGNKKRKTTRYTTK